MAYTGNWLEGTAGVFTLGSPGTFRAVVFKVGFNIKLSGKWKEILEVCEEVSLLSVYCDVLQFIGAWVVGFLDLLF